MNRRWWPRRCWKPPPAKSRACVTRRAVAQAFCGGCVGICQRAFSMVRSAKSSGSTTREQSVRRSREETARTRTAAVEAASRLFRERGIDATSVNDVMAELGMTGGGFYRHFESKEALAVEACGEAYVISGIVLGTVNSVD